MKKTRLREYRMDRRRWLGVAAVLIVATISLSARAAEGPSDSATGSSAEGGATAVAADLWHHDARERMAEAIERYAKIVAAGGWPMLPAGPSLEVGDSDPRVPILRRRLAASGDVAEPGVAPDVASGLSLTAATRDVGPDTTGAAVSAERIYDPALVAAVESFQTRHGLAVDGIVGPRTRAALNVPASERLAALRRNLARLQTFEPSFDDYVLVNIPGLEARLIRGADVALTMKVVVGKRSWSTPTLSSVLDRVVFNPAWNVPKNILRKEMVPKAQNDPDYLTRQNIRVYKDGRRVDPWSVDWWGPEGRSVRLQQRPGRGNALGKVKFLFDNRYHVYMHDTPSKHLFARPRRAFSHGCIRLEKPQELARALLTGQDGWDAAAVDAAFASSRRRAVAVEQAVGVHLVYWTAWVDEAGVTHFREDIYGRDSGPV